MGVVGPGAIQENQISPDPLLQGASEFEYITIFNPLSDDFAIRVAQDVPVNLPFDIRSKTAMTGSDTDVTRNYGLNLKNPDFVSKRHIVNDTIIKSGETINLKGSEAQVAVRQLVNEILQREGRERLMADPTVRNEVEQRIVKRRGSIQDLMDNAIQTPQQQATAALNQFNEGSHEPERTDGLPDTNSAETGSNNSTGQDAPSQTKRLGRPPKANSK